MRTRPDDAAPAIRVTAVLVGWLVDTLSTTIAGIPLLAAFGVDATDQTALDRLNDAPDFLLASLALGLVCTALGGFVTAHLARGAEMRNALVMGVASAASALLLALTGVGGPPVWYLGVGTALTVPAAALGAVIRERTRAETGNIA
ncbi:MAG: hypothetical protein AUH85_16660 [Chloroflexi bacterium 13_1_40CM_4_68_4]|nr:MAG: hypothetical protein AUH85_16660 [Chloroflexi bacterium 13_1_40CM_4_68_4]